MKKRNKEAFEPEKFPKSSLRPEGIPKLPKIKGIPKPKEFKDF